jgi:hypothetical protein
VVTLFKKEPADLTQVVALHSPRTCSTAPLWIRTSFLCLSRRFLAYPVSLVSDRPAPPALPSIVRDELLEESFTLRWLGRDVRIPTFQYPAWMLAAVLIAAQSTVFHVRTWKGQPCLVATT